MHKLLFICCLALIFSACKTTNLNTNTSATKHYELKGRVVSVNKDKRSVRIEHEAIPGYMEAMTMEYPVHEASAWNDLKASSYIRADLVVDSSAPQPAWLENIAIEPDQPPSPAVEDLPSKESSTKGDSLPNFKLTNQDGKQFSLRDYRGKALAITFIYRECPLPDFCIKMSRNFSD